MRNLLAPPNDDLRALLARVRTIAVVGFSPNPARPSHFVSAFLFEAGYRVIPINPGQEGRVFFGEPARARLSDVDVPADMVDIFRRPDHVPGIVDEALAAFPDLALIWMQIGVRNSDAAAKAQGQGVAVVQDRCPKIEIPRLFGPVWRVGSGNEPIVG
ncbi:MAG: CoA-binding protein [Rhodobacteraceae bacterium]|nr:CoA-binding protein [Paracoccaceae bacterium]